MRIQARYELAGELETAYWVGTRAQKTALLDHFCAVTGYHRKYALSLLRGRRRKRARRRRALHYGGEVQAAVRIAWEASGYICAERLRPYLPELCDLLIRHGSLKSDVQRDAKLRTISVATLKRIMKRLSKQWQVKRNSTTRPGSLLRREVPVELTSFEHDLPGYLEIDLVAHCGESGAGQFINTLCATDLATGWTERIALMGKGQASVIAAIEQIQTQLPFPLCGLHSDLWERISQLALARLVPRSQDLLRSRTAVPEKRQCLTSSKRTGRSCAS